MHLFSFIFFNIYLIISVFAARKAPPKPRPTPDGLPFDYYDEKTTDYPWRRKDDEYHDDVGKIAQLKERKYSLPAEFVGSGRRAWINITSGTSIPRAWENVVGFDQNNHLMIKATLQEHPDWLKLIPSSKMEYSGGLKLEMQILNNGKRHFGTCDNPLGLGIKRKVAHLKFLSDNNEICHYTFTLDSQNPVIIRHMHSDWEMAGIYSGPNKVFFVLGELKFYIFPFWNATAAKDQYGHIINMPCKPPEASGYMNPPHDVSIKFYTTEDYSPCQFAIIMSSLDEIRAPIDQPPKPRHQPALPPPPPIIEMKEWTIFENNYIWWNVLGIYAFCCVICAFSLFAFWNVNSKRNFSPLSFTFPLTFFDTHDNLHQLPYDYFEETVSSETESTEASIVDTTLPKWFESSSQKQVSRFGEVNFTPLQASNIKKKTKKEQGIVTVSQVSQVSADVSQISKVSTKQSEKKEENNNANVEVTDREH